MGDGRVNVGVGLLSTDQRWKGAQHQPPHGRLRGLRPGVVGPPPRDEPRAADRREAPHGPLGRAAGRRQRAIAGDASGAINPFNGEGIAYGYETGRLAAAALGHALTGEGAQAP